MRQERAKVTSRPRSTEMSVLLVGMKQTPGKASLRADKELAATLPRSSVVEVMEEPCKTDVISKIDQFNVIHLACHRELDPNPSNSRILFTDWAMNPFTVGEMAGQHLNNVQFMYLAACNTARSRNLGTSLPDESITLAGGCQTAGIASVVGTLWHIPDLRSIELAKTFYSGLLTEEGGKQAAWSLRHAIRAQRQASRKRIGRRIFTDPITWAAYIYVGV